MGTAPHRKGRPFNRAEYDALKTEMMLELLDPGRPGAMPSGYLSHKAVADVRALEHFTTHPEMQVRRADFQCDEQMVVVSVCTKPASHACHLTHCSILHEICFKVILCMWNAESPPYVRRGEQGFWDSGIFVATPET
jgi:hypothetical protein